MRARKLVRALGLGETDLSAIREAVAAAERRTSGEIAVAATPESSSYAFQELLASVILGAVAFGLLLPFCGQITALLDRLSWHLAPWYLPAFCGAVSFLVIALAFRFANIPVIDRIVVPAALRSRKVYDRAIRHFVESGVYATADRTGILIFVSFMEREVRILADTGISARIEQADWDRIAGTLAGGIKAGKTGDALVRAVNECGNLLASKFPAKNENPNELPDGLVILEAGE